MIYTTPILNKYLTTLLKKPKDGYSQCITDIKSIVCPLSFIEVCNLDDVVTRTNDFVLRKVRIPNKEQSWSKSQGYRLILICDIANEKIFLLCVYPKKGKLQSSDLTNKGAGLLLEQFANAKANNEVFSILCD